MANKLDLEAIVQHHDAQLEAFGTRMGHVEKKLDVQDQKLDRIINAVSRAEATPKFEWRTTIGVIKDIGIVFGLVVGGILYLADANMSQKLSGASKELVLLQERQSVTQERIKAVESLVLPQSWAVTRK